MIQNLWILWNINAVIMESKQLWPVFALVKHFCVNHVLPSNGEVSQDFPGINFLTGS